MALQAYLVQAVASTGALGVFELLFIKASVQAAGGVALLLSARIPLHVWLGDTKPHSALLAVRSVNNLLMMGMGFVSYSRLPVGDAVTLQQLSVLITAAVGAMVLREPWHAIEGVGGVLAMAGVVLIAHPDFTASAPRPSGRHVGTLCGLGYALSRGCQNVLMRHLGARMQTHSFVMVFSGALAAMACAPLVAAARGEPPPRAAARARVAWPALAMAAVAFPAQLGVAYGMSKLKASRAAMWYSTEVVSAYALQLALAPATSGSPAECAQSLVGALLILLSVGLVTAAAPSAEPESSPPGAGDADGSEGSFDRKSGSHTHSPQMTASVAATARLML